MFRTMKAAGIAAVAFAALLAMAPAASAQRRGGFSGGFAFGRHVPIYNTYAFGASPGWGWGWGYPYYAPYYSLQRTVPATGDVKLISPVKDATVYVDGGYAGKADKLKKFPLTLGTHDIEVRDHNGRILHQERVQVIRGKTIEVDAH